MRLARAGIILRRRVERDAVVWQLKLPRGRRRVELDLPGDREAVPMEIMELLFVTPAARRWRRSQRCAPPAAA